MTTEVTQAALEPCPNPWCNSRKTVDCEIRAAEAPILMPSRSSPEWAVACPVCPLQTPYFDTEAEAITAWNTRLTAQSGEGRSGAGDSNLDARKAVNGVLAGLLAPLMSDIPKMIEIGNQACTEILSSLAALNARQSGEGERGQ